jgi:hypothetical protein
MLEKHFRTVAENPQGFLENNAFLCVKALPVREKCTAAEYSVE